MKALFLSAGKGTRMMPLTKNTPKPLLDLGDGSTIIESQLQSIAASGCIDEVVFVIGYRAEQIEAKLKHYTEIPIRFIYNPFFETSNNLISLWFGLPEMEDDFIVINGDDIFKPSVLQNLVKYNDESNIVMVIDRKDAYEEEDMKVVTVGNEVLKVSKAISLDEANGESIGMFRFKNRGKQKIVDTLQVMVRQQESKSVFYLQAIQQIIDDGFAVNYVECDTEDWSEIDFHPDLNHIRDSVMNNNFLADSIPS